MSEKRVDSVIDGHKIHFHPGKVAQWLETGDCYPIHVEIGATGRCNQDCVFCALDFARGKRDIDKYVMLRALEDMAKHKVQSVMFGGEGEPTLHKDLGVFVEESKGDGLDVALTTNGVAFNEKLQKQCLPYLSWVKFSVDAGSPEVYSHIHRVPQRHFELLKENIASSAKLKKSEGLEVVIGTQFLMTPESSTEEEATKIVDMLREIKPDYLSVKPYSDHPQSRKNLSVEAKRYNDLEKVFESLRKDAGFEIVFRKETIGRLQEGNKYPKCYGLPFITLIDSRGNVLPCNIFYDSPKFHYGNLYEKSFSEIWEGKKRKEVLEELRRKELDDCRNGCRCDAGNRYLDRLKHPQAHDNFT